MRLRNSALPSLQLAYAYAYPYEHAKNEVSSAADAPNNGKMSLGRLRLGMLLLFPSFSNTVTNMKQADAAKFQSTT